MFSKSINSPRLKALQEKLEAGSLSALAEFWQEIATHSTPLIEPIEGNEEQALVTFLWQAQEALENVVVVSGLGRADFNDKKNDSFNGHKSVVQDISGTKGFTHHVPTFPKRFAYSFWAG